MSGELAISWAPLLPLPIVAALAAAALAAVSLALWRRAPGVWWRAAAAVILITALANPSLIREQRAALNDVVLVVVDESPSQDIEPRPEQSQAALDHLLQALKKLDNTEVRVLRAGGGLEAGEQGTRLFSALRQELSKVPHQRIAGVLMISDGQVHDAPESLEALGFDAPVHLLLAGREKEGDRRITVIQAPRFGIVGRKLPMTIRVDDLASDGPGGLARVEITQDGRPPMSCSCPRAARPRSSSSWPTAAPASSRSRSRPGRMSCP